MPEQNLTNQYLTYAALGYSPEQQKNLLATQQQAALAQALLQQGETPISTEGRSIGGVGYAISPWEGVAKLAQALSGSQGLKSSNEALVNALYPQQPSGGQNGGQPPLQASGGYDFYDSQGNLTPLGKLQILQGNRAVAEMRPPNEVRTAQWALGQGAAPVVGQGLINQATPGQVEYQKGLGTAAAGMAPAGTMPPGIGAPPVRGPEQLPPVQPGMIPPSGPALNEYRQQNGMATPPVDQQRAAMGMPLGTASPMAASQLNPGVVAPSMGIAPGLSAAMPQPLPGESNNQYQERLKAAGAGQKTQAEDTGKNLADATKTFNVAAGQLPRAMERFNQLRQAAQDASSGAGVSDQEPEQGLIDRFLPGPDWARSSARTFPESWLNPKVAAANQTIDQATKQGVLSELGPQLAGLRGNKFLESIASGASGLNPADPASTKIKAINGLQDQYISNLKSLAEQRRSYGDPSAPTDMNLATLISQHADPMYEVHIMHPDGSLGTIKARSLLPAVQSGATIQ